MPTLQDLIEAGIIIPGRSNIAVSYKGTTYTASLEKDGAISYQGASCLLDNWSLDGRPRRSQQCSQVWGRLEVTVAL